MGLGSSWSGDAAHTAFLSSRELQPEALVRPSPWTWACGEAGDGRAVGEGKVWPLLGVGCGCRRPGDTSLRPAGVLLAWPQPGRPIAASDGSWLSSHFNSLASSRRDRDFAGEEPATLWRVHTDPRWARAEFSVSPSLCLSLPPILSDSPPHDYASFFKTPFHFRSFKSRSHSRPVLYVVLNPTASCVTFSVSILQFGVSVEASAGRRDWLPLWPLAIPGPRLLPHPRRG